MADENQRQRNSFTRSLQRIAERIDRKSEFEVEWYEVLFRGNKKTSFCVKALWVLFTDYEVSPVIEIRPIRSSHGSHEGSEQQSDFRGKMRGDLRGSYQVEGTYTKREKIVERYS